MYVTVQWLGYGGGEDNYNKNTLEFAQWASTWLYFPSKYLRYSAPVLSAIGYLRVVCATAIPVRVNCILTYDL